MPRPAAVQRERRATEVGIAHMLPHPCRLPICLLLLVPSWASACPRPPEETSPGPLPSHRRSDAAPARTAREDAKFFAAGLPT